MQIGIMAALSQPVLPLYGEPPRRSLRRRPAVVREHAAHTDHGASGTQSRDVVPFDVGAFAQRLAAAFDGVEALEVGADLPEEPGLRAGDIVLVDRGAAAEAALPPTVPSAAVFAVLHPPVDAGAISVGRLVIDRQPAPTVHRAAPVS
jgi:hypothetical protein